MEKLLHTPEGVRDIYNGECKQKLLLQDRLHAVLTKYGYRDIQTPTFEFFNIFSKEIGTTPSKDLYKFFDKDGNTLVLRPDFTPSVARSAAKYYAEDDMPVKLCYMGNTFINSSSYQGRLKETTQCGVELIGDGSVCADAEILAMVVDSLRASGLKEFQISVGHARFFHGLIEAAGLGEEAEEELRELLNNKNFFGVEEFVETLNLDANLKKLFTMLGSFETQVEELAEAKDLAADYPVILSAIADLEKLGEYLKLYGIEKYISFELGIISKYHYYTGIIFAGYTKEMSEFLQMNSGLASRIPHTFDFEDYTPDEIVKIGLLGLHNAAYEVDEAAYADLVKNNYSLTSDHSNGRWVRNLNEELIMVMSERVAHAEDADINQILQEDLDAVRAGNHGMRTLKSTEEGTEKVVADENGYAVPPGSN